MMKKRLLSMLLTLCMIVSLLPVTAMAEEIHTPIGTSGEITSFAPLTEAEKTVSLGTSSENLELPETLTAAVRTAVPAGEDYVQDSGSPETATPTAANEPEWEETTVDIPVKWDSTPEYDMDTEGAYVFTPVIEGYTVSAALPEITVTVGELSSLAAVRGLVTPMSITNYGIWVGGVQVTSENKDGIIGEGITGTATYDPDTKTLTLNGVTIEKSYDYYGNKLGIYSSNNSTALTINLVGTNTITAEDATGTLSCGINVMGSLTISGTDTATLTAKGGSSSNSSYGIWGDNTITISDSVQVTAKGGTADNSIGIYGYGYGTITISDSAQVTGIGDNAINTSFGIAAGNITISGGTVTATGGTATGSSGNSCGIFSIGTVAISGGTVTAKSCTASATSRAIYKQPFLTDYTNYQWRTAKEGAFTPSTTKAYEWANTHTYVEIKPQPTTINYDLWVGGVQVTSENKDGITGEGITGIATYDPVSKILTLNGVTIESSSDYDGHKFGIDSTITGTLTINLVGTNTITAEDATVSNKNSYGIFVMGSLTISGTDTATLIATGGKATHSQGICGKNTITISGSANVKATGGEATSSSYGIFSEDTITISGGTVTAKSGTASATSLAINIQPFLTGYTNYQWRTASDVVFTSSTTKAYELKNDHTYVEIKPQTAAPTYTVTADPTSKNFGSLTVGYTAPTVQTITITNTGNTSVTLTQPTSTNYTIGALSTTTLAANGTAAFTVTPKTGLAVGNYDETLTVSTDQSTHATVELSFAVTAAPNYTVTFNPNGGTVSETSRSVAPGAAVGTLPTPARSGSYSFDGWYTAASGGTQISASTTVSANVSYYAHWTYTGGGGSGSGGGGSSDDSSSPVIVTPPAPDKPNSPTQGEIKVSGTVDSKGNITVNITDKTVTDAFDKALADAKKNGNEQNGITVVLHVDTGSKTASNVTVNLPKTVQDTIIAQKIVNTIVVVDNPDIRIGMDLASVQAINNQARADVNLTATRMNNSALTGDAASAIGARPVFDLKVNYGSNQVQNFGAGSVSVTIPYTLGANETPGNIQAVYVDANGRMQWLVNSVYDSLNGVLRFSTNHFSTYGVGNKQGAPVFSDVSTHWAADDIAFVANRGLLSGTSKTTFSPNTAMTRGMFVTALGRLANANVSGCTKSSFNDVKRDAYYMGYIEWANKNNIVNGVGNGRFAPDQSITREQMAVIMGNYAKAIGFALPKARAEITFADNAKISAYAKEAVKQMQMAGVISGKNSNLFDPQGTATRAEVSAVLRRFVELAISSNTAQGWTMNDSGKWMYYENGKPLTGKQDIDGATYTFDQYGVTADVPKNLRYTTYTVQKGDSFWRIAHKLGCTMSELERLNNKSRFSLIHPGDVLRVPEK